MINLKDHAEKKDCVIIDDPVKRKIVFVPPRYAMSQPWNVRPDKYMKIPGVMVSEILPEPE